MDFNFVAFGKISKRKNYLFFLRTLFSLCIGYTEKLYCKIFECARFEILHAIDFMDQGIPNQKEISILEYLHQNNISLSADIQSFKPYEHFVASLKIKIAK